MTKSDFARMKKYPKKKIPEIAFIKEEGNKKYDLEERTAKFGEDIIEFAKTVPQNIITSSLIGQLVKAGTSVGADCGEADDAESKKDFRHKTGICKKESGESKFSLRMILKAVPTLESAAAKMNLYE